MKYLIILACVVLTGCSNEPFVASSDLKYLSGRFKVYELEKVDKLDLVIVYADGVQYYWNPSDCARGNLYKRK